MAQRQHEAGRSTSSSGGGPQRRSSSAGRGGGADGRAAGPIAADALLNFRYQRPPPPSSSSQQQYHGDARGRGTSSNNNQDRRRYRPRSIKDPKLFPLHSSPDHAFWIRRCLRDDQYVYHGPDEPVSWDAVTLVGVLHPVSTATDHEDVAASSALPTCPICLDTLTCARITKCGHIFCLPCLLRLVHVSNHHDSSDNTTPVKCPCCAAAPLHLEALRPVQFRPVVPPNGRSTMQLVKLHRIKHCHAPFLPHPSAPRRRAPHAAPSVPDPDAAFGRFVYVETDELQAHLQHNERELHNYNTSDATESVCCQLALERVHRELQTVQSWNVAEEQIQQRFASSSSGVAQPQPAHLVFEEETTTRRCQSTGMMESISPRSFDADKALDSSGVLGTVEVINSPTSMATQAEERRGRGDSITSHDTQITALSHPASVSSTTANVTHSMFMDDADETCFYQSPDGKLCFLSKFNMNCLRHDYASTKAEVEPSGHWHKSCPLPDSVVGRVLDLEYVHLTPDMRQRYRFLSHLPLYIDIVFVELALGPEYLSKNTKKHFAKEFAKRQVARQRRQTAERTADAKLKRHEEASIAERKARYQQIDPNDEFFILPPSAPDEPIVTDSDFPPAQGAPPTSPIVTATTRPLSGLSFSDIARHSGVPQGHDEISFPALGAGSSPSSSHDRSRRPALPTRWARHQADPTDDAQPRPPPPPLHKKKGGHKKVVLFSTGSHRGV